MERNCLNCPYSCKKLDEGDAPVHYYFVRLEPLELITLLMDFIITSENKFLKLTTAEISNGNQLALLVETVTIASDRDSYFHIIAEAENLDERAARAPLNGN